MKKYILAVMLVFVSSSAVIAGYGDVPNYEQKPHLEIKCPCGASFVTYEWLEELLLKRASQFLEIHPCKHKKIWIDRPKEPQRLTATEMVGSETFHTMVYDYYSEIKYHCVRCGKVLCTNPVGYYCTSCKTGFNIKEE